MTLHCTGHSPIKRLRRLSRWFFFEYPPSVPNKNSLSREREERIEEISIYQPSLNQQKRSFPLYNSTLIQNQNQLEQSLKRENKIHQITKMTKTTITFHSSFEVQYMIEEKKIGKIRKPRETILRKHVSIGPLQERSKRSATGGQRLRFPRWIRHVNGALVAELYTHTLPVGNRYTATDNRQSGGEAKVAEAFDSARLRRKRNRNPRRGQPRRSTLPVDRG